MSSTMIISLCVAAVMAVLFVMGKFPFGLVTMSSMLVLVMSGVITVEEGFSGASNASIIMLIGMFAISGAFQKTNLPFKLQGYLRILNSKSAFALFASIIAATMLMETVLGGMVCIMLIVGLLETTIDDSDVCLSRVILPVLMVTTVWVGTLPIGIGATTDYLANTYMKDIVTNSEYLFQLGDNCKVRLLPVAATVIYALFIWRKIPHRKLSIESESNHSVKAGTLKGWQNMLVYVSFISIILVMIFGRGLGNTMYILPALWACIYIFTGILSPGEVIKFLFQDATMMVVGILGVTAALSKSGAITLLGDLLVPLVSWTTNSFVILFLITAFTAFMTTFLSNVGTVAVLTPLVASVAVSAGMDPRALVTCVTIGGTYAFCFPSGSTACALAFSLGEYNPLKVLRYNLPLLLLLCLTTAASASVFFPLYG